MTTKECNADQSRHLDTDPKDAYVPQAHNPDGLLTWGGLYILGFTTERVDSFICVG